MVKQQHWLNGYEFEKIPGSSEGQRSLACLCLTHTQTHGNFGGDGSIYHLNTLVMFLLVNAYVQIKLCSLNMCDFFIHKMYLNKVVKKNNGMLSQSMSILFSFPVHFSHSCQRTIIKRKLWRRKWQPTPVFLPGKSHGQRSLSGYNPWGHRRVGNDLTTEQQQQWISLVQINPRRILSKLQYGRHVTNLKHILSLSMAYFKNYSLQCGVLLIFASKYFDNLYLLFRQSFLSLMGNFIFYSVQFLCFYFEDFLING